MIGRLVSGAAGEVRIRVCGASIERFLNVALQGEIGLWNTVRVDARTIETTLSLSDFYALRRLMGRTGCRVRVIGRRGLPFFAARLRRRWILTGGVCALALVVVLLTQFVWVLEIVAADGIPVSALRDVLRETGIYEGAWLGQIDTDDTRRAIQTEIPEVGVIAITRIGNAVRVEVDAAVPTPDRIDRAAPTGLVATRDGVVSRTAVTGGQLLVQPGEAVEQGQLLVSSAVPNTTEWGQAHRAHGMGRVMAYTSRTVTLLCPLTWTESRATDRMTTRYALIVGDRRINLYLGSGIHTDTCDKITIEKTRLSIGSRLMLPISLVRETCRECDAVPVSGTAQEVGDAAAQTWLDRLAQTLDGTILDSRWTIEEEGGAVRVRVTASCEEQIACEMIDRTPLPEKEQEEPAE